MREILFKAKIKVHENQFYYIKEEIEFLESKVHRVTGWYYGNRLASITIPKNEILSVARMEYCDITLLQYTGLNDKNGVKIFEGDILKIAIHQNGKVISEGIAEVKYMDYSFGVIWGHKKDFSTFNGFVNTTFEVIGNIYDNPNMLDF